MKKKLILKPLYVFLIIVFSLSFILAGSYSFFFPEKDKVSFSLMAVFYMFTPFISALIVDKLILKRANLKTWAINFTPNWWYIAAWPGVIVVTFLVLGMNTLWPGIELSLDMSGFWERMSEQLTITQIEAQRLQLENYPLPIWLISILQSLLYGLTINAVAAFGEETGWRSFMVREYKNEKFWYTALQIGIIWGVWHAPLILMGHNYPEHPYLGVGLMTIMCILLSPVFLYIRIKSHSVIAVSIMHGTLNASAGIPLMFLAGGNELTLGFTGFAGFITLIIIIGGISLYDRKFSSNPITNKTILEAIRG